MTFAVSWSNEAFDSLIKIAEAAPDPDQIISAVRELDRMLVQGPAAVGESRPGGRRIVFSPPLAATYEVLWRLNDVVIVDVWKFEKHNSP
jgi:hypothetical protein